MHETSIIILTNKDDCHYNHGLYATVSYFPIVSSTIHCHHTHKCCEMKEPLSIDRCVGKRVYKEDEIFPNHLVEIISGTIIAGDSSSYIEVLYGVVGLRCVLSKKISQFGTRKNNEHDKELRRSESNVVATRYSNIISILHAYLNKIPYNCKLITFDRDQLL